MSEYKRLTNKDWKENYDIFEDVCCDTCTEDCGECERNFNALVRLAELEDMIASVGDKVYVIYQDYAHKNDYSVYPENVTEIRILESGVYIGTKCGEMYTKEHCGKEYGKTIFSTKEAAEAKLKELRERTK